MINSRQFVTKDVTLEKSASVKSEDRSSFNHGSVDSHVTFAETKTLAGQADTEKVGTMTNLNADDSGHAHHSSIESDVLLFPLDDDATLPVMTFRAILVGLLEGILGAAVTQVGTSLIRSGEKFGSLENILISPGRSFEMQSCSCSNLFTCASNLYSCR